MRRGTVAIGLFLVFILTVGFLVVASAQEDTPEYVGAKKCKICHSKVKLSGGVQYLKWKKARHSQAYITLMSEKAKELGASKGVTNPASSEKCLKCHITTLKFKTPKERAEGVGCERCHGPGSLYKKDAVMKDYEASIAAGMRRLKSETEKETLENIEQLCRQCHGLEHKDESPTAKEFNFEERWAKIRHDNEALKKEFPDAYNQPSEKK